MGIREHFEEMKNEKEVTKLSDLELDVEESEDESEFDPARDITATAKTQLFRGLKDSHNIFDLENFFSEVSHMMILYPEEVKNLTLSSEKLDDAKERMTMYFEASDWLNFLELARGFKALFSDDFDKFKFAPRFQRKLDTKLHFDAVNIELPSFKSALRRLIERLVHYKILWPDKSKSVSDNNELFERLKEEIEDARSENICDFGSLAVGARILFPDRFDEIDINQADWERMKRVLKKKNMNLDSGKKEDLFRRELELRKLGALMKVLAAEKVWVSDQGLELQMKEKKDFKQEKKSRPERRSF